MADHTKIEWSDATWNPITGCSVVSPGCTNCYAMRLAGTRLQHHPSRAGLVDDSKAGPVWNGQVRLNRQWLRQPIEWKKPRMIFVCAHGDLFHESVPDDWILDVFTIMAIAGQHVYQILTKRPERMREFVSRADLLEDIYANWYSFSGGAREVEAWPAKNIWLGTSVEDQKRADERIPHLLATPAAVRWVSAEPLLGSVDFRPWIPTCYECGASCGLRLAGIPQWERCTECGEECGDDADPVFSEGCPTCSGELEPVCPDCGHYMVYQHPDTPNIDWITAGGESGPGARPMHPDWVRKIRDDCAAAGVPFHFKQWGNWSCIYDRDRDDPDWRECSYFKQTSPRGRWLNLEGGHGFHGERVCYMVPEGKKAAGRLLDGREHNAFPETV